ncbi:MAG: hypothetical protein NW207_01250 [Cytophagales bacterium]|nr:hypothetical protein [Cytophagales bacterium]
MKLLLISHLQIIAIPSNTDDFLYIKLAYFFKIGRWLGPYDQYTLFKNAFYSIFIGFVSKSGISLIIFIHLLYSISGIYFITLLKNKMYINPLVLIFTFIIFEFNPILTASDNLRTLREPIYMSLVMIYITSAVYSIQKFDKLINKVPHLLIAGVFGAFAYYTKEEGIWIYFILFCIAILAAFTYSHINIRNLTIQAISILAVFSIMQLTLHYYKQMNLKYYKYYILSESNDGANEKKALALLSKINPDTKMQNVIVKKATRYELYEKIPAFKELSIYEESIFQGWSEEKMGNPGCPLPLGDICKETTHFTWAMRNVLTQLGYYQNPKTADAYYGRLANELEDACNKNIIKCQGISFIQRIVPVLDESSLNISFFFTKFFEGLYKFTFLSGYDLDKSEAGEYSYGNEETYLITKKVTNCDLKMQSNTKYTTLISLKNTILQGIYYLYACAIPFIIILIGIYLLYKSFKNKNYYPSSLTYLLFCLIVILLSRHTILTLMTIFGHYYFRIQYFTPSYTLLLAICITLICMLSVELNTINNSKSSAQ